MDVVSYLSDVRETEAVGAVVLHRHRGQHLAVYHDLTEAADGGSPLLGPGRMLTHDALRTLSQRLSGAGTGRQILPACVLCADAGLLAWHRPATRRPIIFETKDAALNRDVSGRPVLHPQLLFVGRPGRLSAYALAGPERPCEGTALFRAPYFNLYASGAMCEGSVPLPPAPIPTESVLSGYETAFYDSAFAHTNLGHGQLVRWEGGHAQFWRDMMACQEFPAQALIALRTLGRPLTLADVLGDGAVKVDPEPATALLGGVA
jgi:PRTRC genetic system protein B